MRPCYRPTSLLCSCLLALSAACAGSSDGKPDNQAGSGGGAGMTASGGTGGVASGGSGGADGGTAADVAAVAETAVADTATADAASAAIALIWGVQHAASF